MAMGASVPGFFDASQRRDDDGGHHDEDCHALLAVLYEFVDEIERSESGYPTCHTYVKLVQHIDQCPACLEAMGLEQEVRKLLRSRCCSHAPTGLRARITQQLHVQYEVRRGG